MLLIGGMGHITNSPNFFNVWYPKSDNIGKYFILNGTYSLWSTYHGNGIVTSSYEILIAVFEITYIIKKKLVYNRKIPPPIECLAPS